MSERSGRPSSNTSCAERKTPQLADVAFSTGQAARYCFVTGDTVLNWIKNGSLEAQKTPGGQYRIRVSALYAFLREHDMNTALLEAEHNIRPLCWEFNCRRQGALGCQRCLVTRSGASRCWELRGVLHPADVRPGRCDDCDYFRRYCREDSP